MKAKVIKILVGALMLVGFAGNVGWAFRNRSLASRSIPTQTPVGNSIQGLDEKFVAALDVAKVFGREGGCANVDSNFIMDVADEAIKAKLDPRIFAATIAVESKCNQYATSSKGAIGLTMVVPRVWKGTYDFETRYNLLNRRDNLHVGASIESSFIQQYGVTNGLRHYNGMSTASVDYDAEYPSKIELLAGGKHGTTGN